MPRSYVLALSIIIAFGGASANAEEEPGTKPARNLISEGASFECGPDGFQPVTAYSWNDKMVSPAPAPVFDSSTPAAHGKTSLKLTAGKAQSYNGANTFNGAVFKRTLLERDKTYTLAAWLKTDTPNLKASLFCGEGTFNGSDGRMVEVTNEWKRYEIEFKTGNFKTSGYYLTWVGIHPSSTEGHLWIDAVQLEEGAATDFKPASALELGVEMQSQFKLFEKGQDAIAAVRIRNNASMPFAGSMSYEIKDYWGKVVKSGTLDLKAPANGNNETALNFGQLPCGYYKAFCKLDGESEEAIFGVYRPQPLTRLPEDWPLACHNDPTPIVRKMGFGSIRAFHIFDLGDVAPAADKLDFSKGDKFMEDADKCGLNVMPILGIFDWPLWYPAPTIPKYAQERLENRNMDGHRFRLLWPKVEAWKRYVKALVSRYKGRINYWEVLNEPNLSMKPEEYLPYLKASYEAAKEAWPDVNVVGICATSDFEGKPDSFTRKVIELGGHKYLDTLSVHLYSKVPPEKTLGIGSDKALEGWRQLLKDKYGKTVDAWNTEKSYIPKEYGYSREKQPCPLDYCEEKQFLMSNLYDAANWMLRETILAAIGGGHGKFYWYGMFDEQHFISRRIFMPYTLDHQEYDYAPRPALLGANGLAWAMDGMHSAVKQMDWGGNLRCVIFTGKRGSMAALWTLKGSAKASIPLGGAKLELLNFFGEPINSQAAPGAPLLVELNESPKYLRFEGMNAGSCEAIMKRTRLLDVSPKQRASMELQDGIPSVKVEVSNPQLAEESASVSLTPPAGWKLKETAQRLERIPPGGSAAAIFQAIELPESSAGDTFKSEASIGGSGNEIKFRALPYISKAQLVDSLTVKEQAAAIAVQPGSIAIDCDLSDWTDDGIASMVTSSFVKESNDADGWQGPYDASALLRLRWDESNLYLAAKILDDVALPTANAQSAYSSDCLEIFISPDLDGKRILQVLFFPFAESYSGPKCWWIQKRSDIESKVAFKKIADGFQIEAAIPWSGLGIQPKAGMELPFSFSYDDSDIPGGQNRKSVLIWKGDTSNYSSAERWGKLVLTNAK